jgi:histidine triad (HIT) family protein
MSGYSNSTYASDFEDDEPIHTSPHGCVFCELPQWRFHSPTTEVLNIEPLNPVVSGHRIFIPRQHVIHAGEDPIVTALVFQEAAFWGAHMEEDFNLITNAGRAATQSIDHLHVHYIPREEGDGLHLPWTGQVTK